MYCILIVNILFMAPRMVYCSIINLLWNLMSKVSTTFLYTSFIPYTYCTDLSNLIYLLILVNIINVIKLCLIKELVKVYYLLIYLLFSVFIYILTLFSLPILVLISITTILMCLINCICYGSPILLLSFYCVTEEQFP